MIRQVHPGQEGEPSLIIDGDVEAVVQRHCYGIGRCREDRRVHQSGCHEIEHALHTLAVLLDEVQLFEGAHDAPVPGVVLAADVVERDGAR